MGNWTARVLLLAADDNSLATPGGIVLILTAVGVVVGAIAQYVRSRQEGQSGVSNVVSTATNDALKAQAAAVATMQGEIARKDLRIDSLEKAVTKLEADLEDVKSERDQFKEQLAEALGSIGTMKLQIYHLQNRDDHGK